MGNILSIYAYFLKDLNRCSLESPLTRFLNVQETHTGGVQLGLKDMVLLIHCTIRSAA